MFFVLAIKTITELNINHCVYGICDLYNFLVGIYKYHYTDEWRMRQIYSKDMCVIILIIFF